MIFQILFFTILFLSSLGFVSVNAAITVNEVHSAGSSVQSNGIIYYDKNEIFRDDLIRKNNSNVNRITMARNADYIDLADYLLLTKEERIPRNVEKTELKNQSTAKNSRGESQGINGDFFYKDGLYMIKSDWATMHGAVREDWYSVIKGYQFVCKKVEGQADATPVKSGTIQVGIVGNLKEICKELASVQNKNEQDIASYFVNNFTPYMIGDDEANSTSGIFTGYYYPMLNASRERTGKYRYPIYSKPKEFNPSTSTYYTREQISNGALEGKGLEIFWVDDYVDLFFLHIQGSGMLKLPNGDVAHVKFSAKNNQPYASIGKYMTEKKYISRGEDAREFLRHNPRIADEIMNVNKSYIFFEENHQKSVIGSHGSELVDGRSLAVDNKFIPYGLMLYLDSKAKTQVMFSQDTGSAIKGKIRGDIFVGKGFEAGEEAKKIYDKGFIYILVHKKQKVEVL